MGLAFVILTDENTHRTTLFLYSIKCNEGIQERKHFEKVLRTLKLMDKPLLVMHYMIIVLLELCFSII